MVKQIKRKSDVDFCCGGSKELVSLLKQPLLLIKDHPGPKKLLFCVSVCAQVCMCWSQRSMSDIFLSHSSHYYYYYHHHHHHHHIIIIIILWDTARSCQWTWDLAIWLDWLARKLSLPLRSESADICLGVLTFMWMLRTGGQVLMRVKQALYRQSHLPSS